MTTLDRSADAIILEAVEAYRAATGPGVGYLGFMASEAIFDALTPAERRTVKGRLMSLGWPGPDYVSAPAVTQFALFSGHCVCGSDVEFPARSNSS
jgi:hypothetical protein